MKSSTNTLALLLVIAIAALCSHVTAADDTDNQLADVAAPALTVQQSKVVKRAATQYHGFPSALKRHRQLPFKWGKRSFDEGAAASQFKQQRLVRHDICKDLFTVYVQDQQERVDHAVAKLFASLSHADLELLYTECFDELSKALAVIAENGNEVTVTDENSSNANDDEGMLDTVQGEKVTSLSASKRSQNNKRYNTPFRWGK
jgi:hypothetical protein